MNDEKYVDVDLNDQQEEEQECDIDFVDDVVTEAKKPNILRRGWNWVKSHKGAIIAGTIGVIAGVGVKALSDTLKSKNDGTVPMLDTSDDVTDWSEPEEESTDIFEEDTSEEE